MQGVKKGKGKSSVRALYRAHVAAGGDLRFPAFRRALHVAGFVVRSGVVFGVDAPEEPKHAMFRPSARVRGNE